MPAPVRLGLVAAALIVAMSACTGPDTPERKIRALITSAAHAAEKQDTATLRGDLSPHYADAGGRDRDTLDAVVRFYVTRHASIYLLTRVKSIAFPRPDRAHAVVYLAMASRPIPSPDELAAFRASLYRLDIGFAREHAQWRVIRAAWRPAQAADFVR